MYTAQAKSKRIASSSSARGREHAGERAAHAPEALDARVELLHDERHAPRERNVREPRHVQRAITITIAIIIIILLI